MYVCMYNLICIQLSVCISERLDKLPQNLDYYRLKIPCIHLNISFEGKSLLVFLGVCVKIFIGNFGLWAGFGFCAHIRIDELAHMSVVSLYTHTYTHMTYVHLYTMCPLSHKSAKRKIEKIFMHVCEYV